MTTDKKTLNPLFNLGQVVATKGAIAECSPEYMTLCLARHQSGDWGCVCKEDAATNNKAVKTGSRILSAYPVNPELPCKGYGSNCLWIITEYDRSVTTLFLPNEY